MKSTRVHTLCWFRVSQLWGPRYLMGLGSKYKETHEGSHGKYDDVTWAAGGKRAIRLFKCLPLMRLFLVP